MKLETILTLEIVQRDNLERFIKQHIQSVSDYLWLSQPRFYNEEIPGEDTGIVFKQMLYSVKYGSDYILSDTRLLWMGISDNFVLNLLANFTEEVNTVVNGPLPSIHSLANSLGYEAKDYFCSQ